MAGALLGGIIADALDVGDILQFLIAVLVSAGLIALFDGGQRRALNASSAREITDEFGAPAASAIQHGHDCEGDTMKLVVGTFVTLDGVMQAPGGPDEDRDGGFEHGGWLVPHFDEDLGEIMDAWTQGSDAVLFGRKSYEILASHWPHVGDEDPMAAKLNSVRSMSPHGRSNLRTGTTRPSSRATPPRRSRS